MSFDADYLRHSLQPLTEAAQAPTVVEGQSGGLQEYVEHYKLDRCLALTNAYHCGILETTGYSVAVQIFQVASARATVTVLHGYFDHVGLYRHIITRLLNFGFNVVAFDLPGHGLSSGARAAVRSFDEYRLVFDSVLDQCRQLFPAMAALPQFAVGQSTGGAIMLEHLLTSLSRTPFQHCVMLAPLVRPRAWEKAKLMFSLIGRYRDYWPRQWNLNSHDESFHNFIKNCDPLQPRQVNARWVEALIDWIPRTEAARPGAMERSRDNLPGITILQGSDDATVEWEHNLPVIETLFPWARSIVIPDARHHLVNEAVLYRDRVFNLMEEAFESSLHQSVSRTGH
ncbi:alpha/beta hydrolase [Allohahella sp. A8]|uniref:alpha/beta hydrolase n=1 Tax=Allohahella sp. A8 TaxID=3141461 RepID=UPI003A803ABA